MKNIKTTKIIAFFMAVLMILPMVPVVDLTVYAVGEEYYANIRGTAVFNPTVINDPSGMVYITDTPANGLNYNEAYTLDAGELDAIKTLNMVIEDCYVGNGGYWYKVKTADGSDLPGKLADKSWIYQNDIPTIGYPDVLIVTPPPVKPETSEISATVKDATGKDVTVKVEGDLPEGATLAVSVPTFGGEALPNVFDIKVYDKNGNEWQPIDEGKTVTVTIPVTDPDVMYVDVVHFIDYANAINEDTMFVPYEVAEPAAKSILADAITASGREGYVAIELFEKISVDNERFAFETSSFSIYQWENNDFVAKGSETSTSVTFDNLTFGDQNGEIIAVYYATKDHTFNVSTKYGVTGSFDGDSPFDIYTGTKTSDIEGTSKTYTTTVQNAKRTSEGTDGWGIIGYKRKATFDIPETAAPGEIILIRFKASAEIFLAIVIVDNYTIDYQSPSVAAANLPASHTDVTDGIKESYTIPNNVPTPSDSHYTFKGWNTSPDGQGTSYQPGAKLVPKQSMTLYAMWESENSIVKFNPNGGGGTYEDQIVKTGDPIILPEGPNRDNFLFLGWSATKDGYSTPYAEGSSYTVTQDTILYAIWGVNLSITIPEGYTLLMQKQGDFDALPLEQHKYISGQPIFIYDAKTENGQTTYETVLLEGYLKNARLTFSYNNSSHDAYCTSSGASVDVVPNTNPLIATITDVGIDKNTSITFYTVEKGRVSYTISYDVGFGMPVPSTITSGYTGNTFFNVTLPTSTRTGYTLTGWKVISGDGNWVVGTEYTVGTAISGLYGNATLQAQWTPNTYTVTWDVDGTITTKDYIYGDTIVLPTVPSKLGYTFNGWSGYIDGMTMPANNIIFTAQWTANNYKVTWDEGTKKTDVYYEYGQEIELHTHQDRKGYQFQGWNGYASGMKMPANDITFTANWTIITYRVDFVLNGGELPGGKNYWEFTVESTMPDLSQFIPTKEGHTFAGWYEDAAFNTPFLFNHLPDGSMALYAKWTPNQYTITFDTDGGSTIAPITQNFGTAITPPANPIKTGYDFAGWEPAIPATMPVGGVTVKAKWTIKQHTIQFVNEGGTVLQAEKCEYGSTPVYTGETPTKAPDAENTYTFAGWSPAIVAVTGDATYTATFAPHKNKYIITFVNDDGTVLEKKEWEYGSTPRYDGTPTKPATDQYTFIFDGWTTEICAVTGEATYTAKYKETTNIYLVTFINADGTELKSTQVEYGTLPSYTGETPTKEADAQYTYTFAGWSPAIVAVTGDATYTATYTPTVNKYTITWIVDGNTTTEEYEYGATPSFKGSTDKASDAQFAYTFAGWSPAIVAVTGEATYTATYNSVSKSYIVTWVNWDGTELETDSNVPYGTMPEYNSAAPTRSSTAEYEYTFIGWEPVIATVTGNATYKATFSSTTRQYTITFDTNGGTAVSPITQNFGTAITLPANPTKTGYTFAGWDKNFPFTVTQNETITAQWEEIKVTVTYVIVAPAGAVNYGSINGSITQTTQTVGVVTGQPSATVTVNAPTFKFVGWYSDPDCKTPVSNGELAGNTYKPGKVNGLNVAATYYAKFEYNLTTLTITTTGADAIDPNQTFIFNIQGFGGVNLDVTVHGNDKVKIDGLTVGQEYTVTAKTNWSWRYDVANAVPVGSGDVIGIIESSRVGNSSSLTITLGVNGEVLFTFTRGNSQWLDGDSWCDNRFMTNVTPEIN